VDQRVFIAKLNMEHLRGQLAREHDDAKRRIIIRLLAAEEVKLAILSNSEQGLRQLLGRAAYQAIDLFDRERPERDQHESEAWLAEMLDRMPFAVGLMDPTCNWIMANTAMRRFAPRQALACACDPQRVVRRHAFDAQGRALSPSHWPSARALGGQTVYPGTEFTYDTDEGQQLRFRVAAVPVRYANGGIAGALEVAKQLEPPAKNEIC
jgi:PAS domain-containing protein